MSWSKSRFIINHRHVVLNLPGHHLSTRALGWFSFCSEAQEAGHHHGQRDKLIEQKKFVMLPVYHSKILLKEGFKCRSNGGLGELGAELWQNPAAAHGRDNGFYLSCEGKNRSKQPQNSPEEAQPGQQHSGTGFLQGRIRSGTQPAPGPHCTAGTDPRGWAGGWPWGARKKSPKTSYFQTRTSAQLQLPGCLENHIIIKVGKDL